MRTPWKQSFGTVVFNEKCPLKRIWTSLDISSIFKCTSIETTNSSDKITSFVVESDAGQRIIYSPETTPCPSRLHAVLSEDKNKEITFHKLSKENSSLTLVGFIFERKDKEYSETLRYAKKSGEGDEGDRLVGFVTKSDNKKLVVHIFRKTKSTAPFVGIIAKKENQTKNINPRIPNQLYILAHLTPDDVEPALKEAEEKKSNLDLRQTQLPRACAYVKNLVP